MLKYMLPLVAVCGLALTLVTPAEAVTPAPITVVSYTLDYDDNLPMFDGDLDTVKFEVLAGSEYTWEHLSGVGACAYDVDMVGECQLVIDGLGGELFAMEKWDISVPRVGVGPVTITTGALTEDITDTPDRVITSDTRCDNFEGTGVITLSWAPKRSFGVQGTGCNFGPQSLFSDLTGVSVRVTYTSK